MKMRKPTHYETLCSMKAELRNLGLQLQVLENSEPTDENMVEIRRVADRARDIATYIQAHAQQYGMTA